MCSIDVTLAIIAEACRELSSRERREDDRALTTARPQERQDSLLFIE